MSTRALVILRDSFGSEAVVYRSHDGYPADYHGVLAGLGRAAPPPQWRAADLAAALVAAWSKDYGAEVVSAEEAAEIGAGFLDYSYIVMPGAAGALRVVVANGAPPRFEVVRAGAAPRPSAPVPAVAGPAPARRAVRRPRRLAV